MLHIKNADALYDRCMARVYIRIAVSTPALRTRRTRSFGLPGTVPPLNFSNTAQVKGSDDLDSCQASSDRTGVRTRLQVVILRHLEACCRMHQW